MYEIVVRKDGQLRNDVVGDPMDNQFETLEDAVVGVRELQKLGGEWHTTYLIAQITDSEELEGYDVVMVVDPLD